MCPTQIGGIAMRPEVWRPDARQDLIAVLRDVILIPSPALHRCSATPNVVRLLGRNLDFMAGYRREKVGA
jgi:hypothetical protein